MAEALRLARAGEFSADPNPAVGCVIAREGEIVGRGFHRAAGEAHAEVHALREAGVRARGASAYVTLEPCNHQGRTPPCTQALIDAGLSEVVAAMVDPFPANQGQGLEALTRAGLTVRSGLMEPEARALNPGFISRLERGRPWLRLKLAASLDGRSAGPDGRSKWITGASAREDVQRWRARASCILTGIDTVLADDPQMTLRIPGIERTPMRLVLDSRSRMPQDARMLSLNGPVVIASTCPPAWQRDGVEWWTLPAGPDGRVALDALLARLTEREVNVVHVEAGPTLSGALLEAGEVDELLLYQAPVLLGAGAAMVNLPGMEKFEERHHLDCIDARQIGPDWRFRFRLSA